MSQFRTSPAKELFVTHIRGEGTILKIWGLTPGAIELVRNFECFFHARAEELDRSSGFIRSDQTQKGLLCAVRSKLKQQWCRAVVLSPLGLSTVLVRLIDYGPEEQVSVADVRQLDNTIFRYDGQASECILADVEPPHNQMQWSMEAIKLCETELLFQTMSLLIISHFQGVPIVRIAKKGESEPFVQRLINDELAVIKQVPTPSSTPPPVYKMNTLNPSTLHLVKISFIENAQKFFVQFSAAELELNNLMEEIQAFASRPENLRHLNVPQVNQPCLGNHKQRCYRCRIISFNQGMCVVSFVDYGFTEVKAFQELFAIHPRFLQLQAQAICCTLPRDFHIATDDFWRVLNKYKFLECEILAHTGDAYIVHLKSEGRDIFLPPTQEMAQFFTCKKLKTNERCEVNIGYINDISEFYCQMVQNKRELDAITAMLTSASDMRPITLQECQPKVPVCAKFSEDNEWYRAEIVKVNHERDIEVFFVDFGNFDNAILKDLRKITKELLSFPVQAYKCNLSDVDLPTESSLKDEMFEYFEELTAGQSFQALVNDISESPQGLSYSVILHEKSSSASINDKIQNKFFNLVVIPIAETETLYITSFTSLNSFFGQFEKLSSSKLEEMQEGINEFYTNSKNTAYKPKPGDKVCALYNVDNQYYRARVEACSGGACDVVFLDYGNRENIPVTDIHPMNKQFLKYPLFGVECAFSSFPEATPVAKVREVMLENSIQAKMIEEKNNKWLISLTDDFPPNVHVLEIFRQNERAVPRSVHGSGAQPDSNNKRDNQTLFSQRNDNYGNNQKQQSYNKPLSSESKSEKRYSPESDNSFKVNQEVPKNLTQINIPPKAYRNVYVSHVVSPSEFYCQIEEESTKLLQLMQDIETAYSPMGDNELCLSQMKVNSVCCAVFQEDGAWYRGSIKQVGSGNCQVYFVDYGNTDSVPISKIKSLKSDLFQLPVQALKCKLFNAEPGSNTWSEEAIKDFINLTLDKSFVAQFVEVDSNNAYAVNLVSLNKLEEDVLNKQFVSRGHGKLQDQSKLLVLNSHAASSNLSYKTVNVSLGSTEHVSVCYGLTPQAVFCQLKSHEQEFKNMMMKLQHYYNKLSPLDAIVDRPHVGMICVAQFHLDMVWYRGQITKIDKTGISVIYVDYGNTEIVEKKKIRCIAQDFTVLPIQAIKCHIKGIAAPDKSWSSKNNISKYFEGDAECQFVSKEDDHYIINLTVNHKNVAEILIKSGLAVGEVIKRDEIVPEVKQINNLMPKSSPPQVQQLPQRDSFSPGQLLSVAVSYVKSPFQFWCQSLDESDILDKLMADIETHAQQGVVPVNLNMLVAGNYCLAKYSEDEAWYRAQIVSCISAEEYEVFFIDYGNTEVTSINAIAELPTEFKTTYSLCFCCQLLGSSPSKCTTEVNDAFQAFVDEAGQDMTAKIDKVLDEAFVITLLYEVEEVEKNVSEVLFPTALEGIASPSEDSVITTFLPSDIPLGPQEGYVVIVNSPHDFFIQLAGCEDKLTELATELSDMCETGQNSVQSPVVGLACAVKYSEDESWYRAEVINVEESNVDVLFIDYGNVSTVPKSDLKILDGKFLSAAPYAIRCKLNGIVPCKSDQWSETVIDTFQNLTLDSLLGITFICKDIPAVVNLSKDDKDIGQTLVDLELANVDTCAETEEAYTDDHLAALIEDNLHSIPIDQSYPKRKLVSTKLPVKICYVDTHARFFVMPLELSTELDTVMKTLEILYTQCADASENNLNTTVLEEPKAFVPCVAQYSEDELWYRALITEVDGDNIYVTFVDYGNSEVSSLKSLKPLTPELLKIPPIAMECSLYAIQAVDGKQQDLLAKLEEYFVDEVVLEMEVYKPEEPYKVRLYHNGSDIAELFCEDGLAKEVIPPPESEPSVIDNDSFNLTDDAKNNSLEIAEKQADVNFKVREVPTSEEISVNVKHCEVVNDKIAIFAVPVDLEDDLANFQEKLQTAYGENQPSLEDLKIAKCCIAKYVEDDNWYRAKILNITEEGIRVQFVDYGNSETVDKNDLKELLPEFISEPLYSNKFCPMGLTVEKPDEVREKLDVNLYNGPVILQLCKHCKNQLGLCFTTLMCESGDLLESLLSEELLSQTFILDSSLEDKFEGVIENLIGNTFYILPKHLHRKREELQNQLMEQLQDGSASLDEIKPLFLYAAKIEDKWNRVSIVCSSETDCLVLCVDFGVNSTVELSHLTPLPLEFRHEPLLLHPCSIKDYEEMPLECREIILGGIENSKTFHFEIDRECSSDLLLEVKLLSDSSTDDQKNKSPEDSNNCVDTDHEPHVSEDTVIDESTVKNGDSGTTNEEIEEPATSEEIKELASDKSEEVCVSSTPEVESPSKKEALAINDLDGSEMDGDIIRDSQKITCTTEQLEDLLKDVESDISKDVNHEILKHDIGKEMKFSEVDYKEEARKNLSDEYQDEPFECEDDAIPESTDLLESEQDRVHEFSDVESEIEAFVKQESEMENALSEAEIVNVSNKNQNDFSQEPESSCSEHLNVAEDISQEPESSCLEQLNVEEDISQEPESLYLEHLNEAKDFSQEPESSCLEHLSEVNFSQEPESFCPESTNNEDTISQEPESSHSSSYLNKAENLSQEPESSCPKYLNEAENFSQEPESSYLEHANEVENFSQEPESSCAGLVNEAENSSQDPESTCLEHLNESDDISQEPESSCLEHINKANNFPQESESSYSGQVISQESEDSHTEISNELESSFSQPESLCSDHLSKTEPNSAACEREKTMTYSSVVQSKSVQKPNTEIVLEAASKLINDNNVVEDNDWDERPECDIKQELLAQAKSSISVNGAAECEAQIDTNLPLEEGVQSPEKVESDNTGYEASFEEKSNSLEHVNNHSVDESDKTTQSIRQLSELAGEVYAGNQQVMADPPHKLTDGNIVSHVITVSGGSILFPAIPKSLLPKLAQFNGMLHQFYSLELPIPDSVTVSDLYAVFHEGEWSRAKVLDTKESLVAVIFIDNGSCADVEMTAVRQLKDEHKTVPPFALWCVLASAFCLPQNEQILQVFLDAMLVNALNTKQDISVKVIQEEEPYKVNLLIEGNELLNVLLSEKQVIQQLNSATIEPGEYLAKVSCLNCSDGIELHINLTSELEKLKELDSSMQLAYSTDNMKLPIVEFGVYAVQYKDAWKRGQAVASSNGQCIHLVDSGEKMDLTDVYPLLPEHCVLPPCSILCETGVDIVIANCDLSDALKVLSEKEFKVQLTASNEGGYTAKVTDEQFLNDFKEILSALFASED